MPVTNMNILLKKWTGSQQSTACGWHTVKHS